MVCHLKSEKNGVNFVTFLVKLMILVEMNIANKKEE